MQAQKVEVEKVIVVWGFDSSDGSIHTVSFNNGKSRIYERDNLPRALGELPHCSTMLEVATLTEGKGPKVAVQLDYDEARRNGLL